jgi:hypothetical protein
MGATRRSAVDRGSRGASSLQPFGFPDVTSTLSFPTHRAARRDARRIPLALHASGEGSPSTSQQPHLASNIKKTGSAGFLFGKIMNSSAMFRPIYRPRKPRAAGRVASRRRSALPRRAGVFPPVDRSADRNARCAFADAGIFRRVREAAPGAWS